MIPQVIVGLQQLAAVALGTSALACLPVIANSGGEEEIASTNSTQTAGNEPPNAPPASDPSGATNFSLPQFSFEFPELPSPVDATRSLVKSSLVILFDIADQTHSFFAEIAESVQDLVTEAKLEQQEMAKGRVENSDETDAKSPSQPIAISIEDSANPETIEDSANPETVENQ